jgi:TPR repeat protein
MAARAGYHNSQYDLGWLMLTHRAPGVEPKQAEENGLFWLRRAAELDHQFAKKKLQEGGHAEAEIVDEDGGTVQLLINALWQSLRDLFQAR